MIPRISILCLFSLMATGSAFAYPEFQSFIEIHSGRNVNCAMCHSHPDGPEGLKPGQIGSLSPQQLEALNQARAAFEPGQEVDSPVLNEFGNHIMELLGKQRFLQIRQDPVTLAEALGQDSDLDGDGISDAEEYLAGTHPLDPNHGSPWTLFLINIQRRWFHILMIALATAAGLYGLSQLLRGFESMQDAKPGSGKPS